MGDITFYKSKDGNMAKEKSGIDGSRIANDPKFARTRENGMEFGEAGRSGKVLRDSLRSLMMNASDSRVTSRVTQVMSAILKHDSTSARGQRTVAKGLTTPEGLALLKGIDFNISSSLRSVLFKNYMVDTTSGVITIENLVPLNDVVFPAGATHMSIQGGFAVVDFELGTGTLRETNIVELGLVAQQTNVTLTPVAVPTSPGVRVFVLRIEFFQNVNGQNYGLKNGLYNALSILEVVN